MRQILNRFGQGLLGREDAGAEVNGCDPCCGKMIRLRTCWDGLACGNSFVYMKHRDAEPGDRILTTGGVCYQGGYGTAAGCVNFPYMDVRVTGAGSGSANDDFVTTGNLTYPHPNDSERWVYQKNPSTAVTIFYSGGAWYIGNLYKNVTTAHEPPDGAPDNPNGWEVDLGVLPIPTITKTWISMTASLLAVGDYTFETLCCGQELVQISIDNPQADDMCCDVGGGFRDRNTVSDLGGIWDDSQIGCGSFTTSTRTASDGTVTVDSWPPQGSCAGAPTSSGDGVHRIEAVMKPSLPWFESLEVALVATTPNLNAIKVENVLVDGTHDNEAPSPVCGDYFSAFGGSITTTVVLFSGAINAVSTDGNVVYSAGDVTRPEQRRRNTTDGLAEVDFDVDALSAALPEFTFVLAVDNLTVFWIYNADSEVSPDSIYLTDDAASVAWQGTVPVGSGLKYPACASYGQTWSPGTDEFAVVSKTHITYLHKDTGAVMGTYDPTDGVDSSGLAIDSPRWIERNILGTAYYLARSNTTKPLANITKDVVNWEVDLLGTGEVQFAQRTASINADAVIFVATTPVGRGLGYWTREELFAVNLQTFQVMASYKIGWHINQSDASVSPPVNDLTLTYSPSALTAAAVVGYGSYVIIGGPNVNSRAGGPGCVWCLLWQPLKGRFVRQWNWRPHGGTKVKCTSLTNDGTYVYVAVSETGGQDASGSTVDYGGEVGHMYCLDIVTGCVMWKVDRKADQRWWL